MLLYREIHFALKKYGSTDFHIFIVVDVFLYRDVISLLKKYGSFGQNGGESLSCGLPLSTFRPVPRTGCSASILLRGV